MIDLTPYLRPKERLDLEDGIEICEDAVWALDEMDKRLRIMRKLAFYASQRRCDPVKRIQMNLLFQKLLREIDELADTSTGGIQVLNGGRDGVPAGPAPTLKGAI